MMTHAPAFLNLVSDAKQRIREVPPDEVRRRLADGPSFLLLDVRERSEWDQARIPGASHLARGILERDVEGLVSHRDAELVLYCGGGYRSALAAESLERMGFTNVWSMAGGIREWAGHGLPIAQGCEATGARP